MQFVPVPTEADARAAYPHAAIIHKTTGGFVVFFSALAFRLWRIGRLA